MADGRIDPTAFIEPGEDAFKRRFPFAKRPIKGSMGIRTAGIDLKFIPSAPGARIGTTAVSRVTPQGQVTGPRGVGGTTPLAGSGVVRRAAADQRVLALQEQINPLSKVPAGLQPVQGGALERLTKLLAEAKVSQAMGGRLPAVGGAVDVGASARLLEAARRPEERLDVPSGQFAGQRRAPEEGVADVEFNINEVARRGAQREADDTGKQITRSIGGKLMQFSPRGTPTTEGRVAGGTREVPAVLQQQFRDVVQPKLREREVLAERVTELTGMATAARNSGDTVREKRLAAQRDEVLAERDKVVLSPEEQRVADFFETGETSPRIDRLLERAQPGFEQRDRLARAARKLKRLGTKGKAPGVSAKDVKVAMAQVRDAARAVTGSKNIEAAREFYNTVKDNKRAMRIPELRRVRHLVRLGSSLDDALRVAFKLGPEAAPKVISPTDRRVDEGLDLIEGILLPDQKGDAVTYDTLKEAGKKDEGQSRRAQRMLERNQVVHDHPDVLNQERFAGMTQKAARRASLLERWELSKQKNELRQATPKDIQTLWELSLLRASDQVKRDWKAVRPYKLSPKQARILGEAKKAKPRSKPKPPPVPHDESGPVPTARPTAGAGGVEATASPWPGADQAVVGQRYQSPQGVTGVWDGTKFTEVR